ncbi:MAG: flagellar hook capping FlgD N-terminal domain-containing protein [Paracoccaceae bacterium]
MDTNPISTTTSSVSSTPVIESSENRAILSSDFDVFLQMLTAQARYQDPLEPVDSSEYASQLAQFSMVEQQVLTNDLVENLMNALTSSETGNMAQWIGMEALTNSAANFKGSPLTVIPNPPSDAESVNLIAYNGRGEEVQRFAIGTGTDPISWNGILANGTLASNGSYSFETQAIANGAVYRTDPAQTYTRVVESRMENGQMRLVLDTGEFVNSEDIVGLREPSN